MSYLINMESDTGVVSIIISGYQPRQNLWCKSTKDFVTKKIHIVVFNQDSMRGFPGIAQKYPERHLPHRDQNGFPDRPQ